jgi:hypothetical protein
VVVVILSFTTLTGLAKKIVDFPLDENCSTLIIEALVKSPSIEMLCVQQSYYDIYHHLRTLAEIPSLKAIVVRTFMPNSHHQVVNGHPKLMALIQYEDPPPFSGIFVNQSSTPTTSDSEIPTLSNSSPMSSASADVQDKIWSRVLEFALEIHLLNGELDRNAHYKDHTRGRLLLVSKKFKVSRHE